MDEPECRSQISCPVCRTTIRVKKKSTGCTDVACMITAVLCCLCFLGIFIALDGPNCYDPCHCPRTTHKHHCPNCGASFDYEE